MAVYSTAQSNSSYGNCAMSINIYRGDCTRTETSVTFSFGVCFKPTDQWTTNSIAAHYGGTTLYANATRSSSSKSQASVGTNYHAKIGCDSGIPVSTGNNTSEYLGFSFSKSDISATTSSVSVTVGVGWANWAGSQQGTLTFSLSIPEYHSAPKPPKITVSDNGDNTFSISATKGTAGINNGTETISSIQYKIGDGNWTAGSSGTVDRYSTVYGRAWTDGTYLDSDWGTGSASVKYYHKPSSRPTPVISFDTKKPTLKSNFTISWGSGSQYGTADYNAIKGYRIRLAKGSDFMQLGTSNEYIERTSAGSISFNILDKNFNIAVGDSINATLHIWSENGKGDRLWYDQSSPAVSNYVTIVNMGVVWLRINDTWVEGQVWSRDGSTWDECTGLFARDSSTWKESTT